MGTRFEQTMASVREAVAEPTSASSRPRIVKTLDGAHGLLVSVAVGAVVRGDDEEPVVDRALLERLPATFERLRHDAVKRDPQCVGKTAIVKALRRAEWCPEAVMLTGVRTVQREPVWGGRVDTAAELRGVCAMALMEEHHPRALVEAAHLLADPETAARSAAARAMGASGRAEAVEPLLRLRIETGETEPEVLAECFGALLLAAPGPSLAYVAGYLEVRDDAVAESAALALGSSRLDGALAPLRASAERRVLAERRGVVLLAIAMLRSEPAWAWLVAQVQHGPRGLATGALRALATFKHDSRLSARVSEAVARRSDGALESDFEEIFV